MSPKPKSSQQGRVIACGGVVFKPGVRGVRVCLIYRRKMWALPKGHQEKGETHVETARREIREETGLRTRLRRRIGFIDYQYREGRRLFDKRVHYFLFRFLSGRTQDHDEEVDAAKWFPLEKAIQLLGYENERKILLKAQSLLAGVPRAVKKKGRLRSSATRRARI